MHCVLAERGFTEGGSLSILWRFADERPDRLAALAQELVAAGAEVIVATTTAPAVAARDATKSVPI